MPTKVNFKQFNSPKPAKYEVLFKFNNACRYPSTFTITVYAVKAKENPTVYYTCGTKEAV